LTALKSNSNTVWFNFQTYIYIYIYRYIYNDYINEKKLASRLHRDIDPRYTKLQQRLDDCWDTYMENNMNRGGSSGGGTRRAPPLKLEKI
jgi:hypothetical protein